MNEQLISFDTALLAKSKKFVTNLGTKESYEIDTKKIKNTSDISCLGNNTHNNIAEAPTQSLLQKWLREKHKIYVFIHNEIGRNYLLYYYTIKSDNFSAYQIGRYKSYEEALEDALSKSLCSVSETAL